MPGGDRTGPMGMGSRTGRAAGHCAGYDTPGYANPFGGRGFGGGGFGGGHRWRHWFHATGVPGWARFGAYPSRGGDLGTEKEFLSGQVEALKLELEAMQKRLAELESGAHQPSPEASR